MNASFMKTKNRFHISKRVSMIFLECLTFFLGFFLTPIRFIFDTYPFGIALVASASRFTPFAYAGAVLSAFFFLDSNVEHIIALTAVIGLRIVGSIWLGDKKRSRLMLGKENRSDIISSLFSESRYVKIAIGSFSSLGIGIYRVISGGYLYYDFFVMFFLTVFSAITIYAFCGVFDCNANDKRFLVSSLSFVFCAVYALRLFEIGGINIAMVFSCALILYVSKYVSRAEACAVGTVFGLCFGAPFAPSFAILAIISGSLWKFSHLVSILSSLLLSVGYAIFVSGYEAITTILPEFLCACLFMYSFLKFEVIPTFECLNDPKRTKRSIKALALYEKSELLKESINNVSRSLAGISELISNEGKNDKILTHDASYSSCMSICERYCTSCPKNQICWRKDMDMTKENLSRLSNGAVNRRFVSWEDVDEKFLHRCPNVDTIIDEINKKCVRGVETTVKNDKLSVSANDYDIASKIVDEIYAKTDAEGEKDKVLTEKIVRASSKIGFICDEIAVYGARNKIIIATGIDVENSKCTQEKLLSEFEKAVGYSLSAPSFEKADGETRMMIKSKKRYDIDFFSSSVCAKGETENGDTLCSFFTENGKFYMILCDGMGSGHDALKISNLCSEFLKKILLFSGEKSLAVSMLNNFIRSKNTECSSSVDILEIDLLNGSGSFIKSGAGPSFVKRGENIFRLQSKTAPIGIMKDADAEELSFSLKKDDIIIMVSDGISTCIEESDWLADLIRGEGDSENIDTLPDKIIKFATENGVSSDDMTVGIARLK